MCGRTDLFLKSTSVIFREIKCSTSTIARQSTASVFHRHGGNIASSKPDNCVCWHCCHPFDDCGFRLPRIYDPTSATYHVYGWYCSANCAKAYILEHSNFDRGYQMNVFVRMLRDVHNITESINEAPPRLSLSMFGGPFDIETFRTQKNICVTLNPPFVSYCMIIEERPPISNIGEATQVAQKGTVRGLRRPAERPAPQETEEISGPRADGMYAEFLQQKLQATHVAAVGSAQASGPCAGATAVAKRSRSKPEVGTANGGLAKFAKK